MSVLQDTWMHDKQTQFLTFQSLWTKEVFYSFMDATEREKLADFSTCSAAERILENQANMMNLILEHQEISKETKWQWILLSKFA